MIQRVHLMNDRERWLRTMHFQSVDHVIDMECGFWPETLTLWHEQGLPIEIRNAHDAAKYFRLWRPNQEWVTVNLGLLPPFAQQVLHEDERYRTIADRDGVTYRTLKDGSSTVPHGTGYPVNTPEEWRELERRMDPLDPKRYPSNWDELKDRWARREAPLGIYLGGLFAWPRKWMGVERLCVAFAQEPAWIHRMLDFLSGFILTAIDRAVREVDLDFALLCEDMCFRGGPLISPKMFEEFLLPRYQRMTAFLNANGIHTVILDCDGDISELVPLWIAGGVNTMFPLEVRAGTDPFALREKHGDHVLLCGGIDKTRLAQGEDAIRTELRRIAPLVQTGGYAPHLDHLCPPDVTLKNYRHYLRLKRELLRIPEPKQLPLERSLETPPVEPLDFVRTDEAAD